MTLEVTPATAPATADDALPRTEPRNWWTLGSCAAMLLLFAFLSYSAVLDKTATYDEPLHAVSGYAIRTYGDYRIDPEDPALFTWLASLPHGSNALKFDTKDPILSDGKGRADPRAQPIITESHDLQWIVAAKTMYRTEGNDPDAYLNRSRFLFMLIGLLAGGLVTWWAWQLAGRLGAFAATAAYTLDPNFLGHASLVKNDVPLALVTLGMMFAIWRFGKRGTWWNLSAIMVALAAAMNVKFSGPVFFTITFVVLLIRAGMSDSWSMLRWQLDTRAKRLIVPFGVMVAGGIFSYLSIWACYGFRFAPTSDPEIHFQLDPVVERAKTNIEAAKTGKIRQLTPDELKAIPDPPPTAVFRWMLDKELLPEAWLNGFYYTFATTRMRGAYLNGDYSITGWWYFFPLCVLYKTPSAVLLVLTIALVAGAIRWRRAGFSSWELVLVVSLMFLAARAVVWMLGSAMPYEVNVLWNVLMLLPLAVWIAPLIWKQTANSGAWSAVCIAAPLVIYGGLAMTSNFNLGIRHILPLLPFMHLTVGVVAAGMIWRWGKIGALAAGGLGMTLAIESCSAWPDYIAFLNAPAGGWRGGVYKLSDSNLDWGQDLAKVAQWQEKHPKKLIYLCYFGIADPEYYGIRNINMVGGYVLANSQNMPQQELPGVIMISVTNLQGTYLGKELRDVYSALWKVEPREILGKTIYVYDWPLRPPTTQR